MNLNEITLTPLLDSLQLTKIEDKDYFGPDYKDYISNSRLGLLNPNQNNSSPEKFFIGFEKQEYNPSFELGSLVHMMVLQPEYFEMAPDLDKPAAKLGAVAELLYPKRYLAQKDKDIVADACKQVGYWANSITDTRIKTILDSSYLYWQKREAYEKTIDTTKEVLYYDNKTRLNGLACIYNLTNMPEVNELLHPEGNNIVSECEQAILLDIEAKCPNGKSVILKLKAKLDNYTIDFDNKIVTVNDVKTFRTNLTDNIFNFHYSREFANFLVL